MLAKCLHFAPRCMTIDIRPELTMYNAELLLYLEKNLNFTSDIKKLKKALSLFKGIIN